MNNLAYAFRTLLHRGRNNIIKIVCLSLGLAVGLLIIADVNFESSYDKFYPDYDRIYRVNQFLIRNGECTEFPQTPGGVGPTMGVELPQVQNATRFTYAFNENSPFQIEDNAEDKLKLKVLLADSCFFDVFERPILIGNPKVSLSEPNKMFVSETTAKKLGGVEAALGKKITYVDNPEWKYEIAGVFADQPKNSILQYDAIASINLLGNWSLINWLGNDRYHTFVKLAQGVDPEDMKDDLRQMQERHMDIEQLENYGVELNYTLRSLNDEHNNDKNVRNMLMLLTLLAITLIAVAVLNYLLLVVSTLISRSKEIAVKKCYGAANGEILSLTLSEALVHLFIALLLAVGLIFLFSGTAKDIFGFSPSDLLTGKTWVVLAAICIVILIITSVAPAYLLGKIPVAAAFRKHRKSNRVWKLSLIVVQFMATAYIVCLLVTITRQYHHLQTADPGFNFENIYICDTFRLSHQERKVLTGQMQCANGVEAIAAAFTLPINGASGNEVWSPDGERSLFNFADLYNVTDNYFDVMEIPIIEGRHFENERDTERQIMVSKDFADKYLELMNLEGSIVGRNILVSEHGMTEVIGVYDDIRIGSGQGRDDWLESRPSVVFLETGKSDWGTATFLLIKVSNMEGETLATLHSIIEKNYPDKDIDIISYSNYMNMFFTESRALRNAIMICGVIALIITLIGLQAYVQDDVNRRRKEIAVRRVNGAERSDIQRLFIRDISWFAVPALVAGAIAAYFGSAVWLQKFSVTIELGVLWFVITVIALYLIVLTSVLIRTSKAAATNPTVALNANE